MARHVRHAAEFEADVRAQVDHLARHEQWKWIDRLEADLRAVEDLLAAYPRAGRELERRGSGVLRRVALRSTPFFVWYQLDDADVGGPIMLYRLFHVRQGRRLPEFMDDERTE